jgi:tetratricopeptide (TPR) repeat protein
VKPEAWALLVQARAQMERFLSPDVGRALLLRCVALDPEFALGWAELARCEQLAYFLGVEDETHLELGFEHVRHALELDPEEPAAHMTLGQLHVRRGEGDAAVASARRALELAPGDAALGLLFASLLLQVGRPEEAMPVLRNLTRLDPAQRYMHLFQLAACYRRLGRVDEAIAKHRECIAENPDFFGAPMNLAAIHAELGEMNQARAWLAELLRLRPDFSVAKVPRLYKREFLVENLRKAGLRE